MAIADAMGQPVTTSSQSLFTLAALPFDTGLKHGTERAAPFTDELADQRAALIEVVAWRLLP
jgi:hypothetical protein